MSAATTAHRPQGSRTSLRRHLGRALGRDRNPLCRPLDRAYSRLLTGLALAVLATFVAGAVAAVLVYRAESHTAWQVGRHRHVVTAVTTGPAVPDDLRTGGPKGHAPARWTYPAGPDAGSVPVSVDTPAGTAVPVGLDDAGLPVGAPRTTGQILSDTVLVGLVTVSVLGFGVEGAFAVRRHVLERRAEVGWESAWERVEPRWSGRR